VRLEVAPFPVVLVGCEFVILPKTAKGRAARWMRGPQRLKPRSGEGRDRCD